jgi:hypothetical protein
MSSPATTVPFRRGDFVVYSARSCEILAIVRGTPRSGLVSVEARFRLKGGRPLPGYLGFRYLMEPADLALADLAAVQ